MDEYRNLNILGDHVDYGSESHIPELPGSVMVSQATSRFSSAIWFKKMTELPVTVCGCGGIGSWAALLLSRLAIQRIDIYDPDKVEMRNLSGQIFKTSQTGYYKADAVLVNIREFGFCGSSRSKIERFNENSTFTNILVCGLDSMESRKTVFNAWKNRVMYRKECNVDRDMMLFIDGRLSADTLQIFCIKGDDDPRIKEYEEKWLFDDSEAEHLACSYKQTTYMAAMIGSLISNLVVNFVTNSLKGEEKPLYEYSIPFLTEYEASSMTLRTVE